MKKLYAVLLLVCLCLCAGCGEQQVQKSDIVLDTAVTLTADGADAKAAIDESMARLKNIDGMVNPNVPDSDVCKLAQYAGSGHWVSLHPEVYKMLAFAQEYAAKTNGAFDVTTKPLVDLWGIGTDHAKVPSPQELMAAQKLVGWQKLELNEETHSARLQEKGMGVDLGGIAKGYIADQMKAYLQKEGISQGIINLGGNVLTLGEKENGDTYSIGVQKPFAESGTSLGIVKVPDASVVSSGIYERYYRVNGKLYHHLLSTENGYPIENNLYQVTIISQSSMDGDALSTTCFALGLTDGMQLIEDTDDVEAIFVTDDGEIHYSSGIGKSVQFEQ